MIIHLSSPTPPYCHFGPDWKRPSGAWIISQAVLFWRGTSGFYLLELIAVNTQAFHEKNVPGRTYAESVCSSMPPPLPPSNARVHFPMNPVAATLPQVLWKQFSARQLPCFFKTLSQITSWLLFKPFNDPLSNYKSKSWKCLGFKWAPSPIISWASLHFSSSCLPSKNHIPLTVASSLFLDSLLKHQSLSEVSPVTSFHTAPTPLSHIFLCFIWLQSGNHHVTYDMYNIYLFTCLNTVFATEIMLYGNDPVPASCCLFQGTRKCLSDWKSSINIFWLLDIRSPGPWLLQPGSNHVPSSEMPLQVASPNQAGDTFGRNRADTELNSWTRKDQKGLKEGPGEQGQWGKTEFAVSVIKGNRGWEAPSPRRAFFSPRPLSFSSPSFSVF